MKQRVWIAGMVGVLVVVTSVAAGQHPGTGTPVTARGAARGQYIVDHVAMCVECHSPRDENGNLVPTQQYLGAPIPIQSPFPGREWALRAPRIAGLPGYTRDLAIRLLVQGTDRNNARLRPPMPQFRMTTEDAEDVVDYLLSRE